MALKYIIQFRYVIEVCSLYSDIARCCLLTPKRTVPVVARAIGVWWGTNMVGKWSLVALGLTSLRFAARVYKRPKINGPFLWSCTLADL